MDKKLSRRHFLQKSGVALGTAALCDLTGFAGIGRINSLEVMASEQLKEDDMPHVSVKLFPGRSEETKQKLADAIVKDVVDIIGCSEHSVSVAIEDVSSSSWKEEVYDPEIQENMKNIYKKPGYSM